MMLLWLLAGCREEPKIPGIDLPDVSAQNVLVLNLDTTRRDRLPFDDYTRQTLPLTGERPFSVIDGVWSGAGWTVPATSTQLSGRPVHLHHVRDDDLENGEGDLEGTLLTTHVQDLGWQAHFFGGNPYFERVAAFAESAPVTYIPDAGETSNARALAEATLTWIDSVPEDQPFLAWVQPMDAHGPWDPHPEDFGTWADVDAVPFDIQAETRDQEAAMEAELEGASADEVRQAVSDVYDEQLLDLDRALDALLTELEARGRLDHTLVVLTSDHGEQLFDSDPLGYGHLEWLTPAVTNVTLALMHPDLPEAVWPCLTSSADLAPTLLDLLDLPELPGAEGASIRQACRQVATSEFWLRTTLHRVSAVSTDGRIEADCKTGEITGFNLKTDPFNRQPLSEADTPDAALLRDGLVALRDSIEDETQERCRLDTSW